MSAVGKQLIGEISMSAVGEQICLQFFSTLNEPLDKEDPTKILNSICSSN